MIQVKRFFCYNELRNYSYLLYDDQSGDAWAIDPFEAGTFISYLKKHDLALKGILNTHQHFDHVRGNAELISTFGCSSKHLYHREKIDLGDVFVESLDTPGHTLDHQVFVLHEQDRIFLFSGDTLFNGGVGNCRGGGDVNLLYETTKKLVAELPLETLLHPGHDYRLRNIEFALSLEPENKILLEELRRIKGMDPEISDPATLAEELKVNPFLRLGSSELRQTLLKKGKDVEEVGDLERDLFIRMRQLRDQW
jgi:hydroxyacylglutathione hydrolase